jgi:hypothetical protein
MKKAQKRFSLAILPLILMCITPGFSQTNTTGAIVGRATDNTGAIIPGVQVTITSPAMIGGARNAVTDEAGAYQFTLLVPGAYRVSFALPGFKTLNIDGVAVTAGTTMTIPGSMEVATVAEEVTVTSETPAIDLQAATVGVNWEQAKMDDLPWGRSIVALAQQIPGVYATNYDVGGNQMGGTATMQGRLYGRSGGEVRVYDGMVWCMGFDDYGSYEEVQLSAAAKGAEAMSPGILANYVVKSGGNDLHGFALASWEDGSFQSNNVDQALLNKGFSPSPNNFTRYNDFDFGVGGPIKRNKLWFYTGYDNSYTGQHIAGFVSQATSQPAVYSIQLNILTVKLSYQLNTNMKLEATVQAPKKAAPYRTGSAFVPLEATQNQNSTTAIGPGLKWTYIMSPKMTSEVGIEREGYWWPTIPWTHDPRIIDLTTTQTRGAYLTNYTRPIRWQWNGSWSWFTDLAGKSNEMKTGFLGWWDKQYTYNSGYPYQEMFEYKSQAADITGCTGINCNYFSRPSAVITYDYPNYTASVIDYESWYFNDKINLTKKLTVNAGVRYDHYSNYLPAQGNPGTGPFAAGEKLYPQISNFPTFHRFVPRLSLAYDVRGDGRLALKASYAGYAAGASSPGSAPGATGSSVNQATTISRTYTNWDGSIPYVPVAANLASVSGGGGVQSISSNLSTPYTYQYTAGVQAGWHKDYLVGFTAVRTFDYGGSNKLNLALPYSAYTLMTCAADPGRNNGVGAYVGGQNPTPGQVCVWAVPKSYPTFSAINNLYVNYARGEGTKNYTAFQTTFQKQKSHGWSMLFGYTLDFGHVNNPNQKNFTPNSLVYNWQLPQWNQSIKLDGTYDLPWRGIKYSATYQVQSGAWYGRYVNVTNANNQVVNVEVEQQQARYPFVKLWDNRLSKLFKVGDRQTLEAMFDLYNTLNTNTVLQQVTTNGPTFGQPVASSSGATSATAILPARIFKLGMRWRF